MEPVRNHRNRSVVEASRLHRAQDRHESGLTLIEGPHLLEEALRVGVGIETIFYREDDQVSASLAKARELEAVPVTEEALRRVAGTKSPRGPVCVVRIPPEAHPDGRNLLVSWGVGDPGNVGTMIRIAGAFGWAFGYVDGTADPWSPKVLRAGSGTQFWTPIIPVTGLSELANAGYQTVATVVSGGTPLAPFDSGSIAVLIGDEAAGLSQVVIDTCDHVVTIPMPGGAESLNAGVAAGIIVFELGKQTGIG